MNNRAARPKATSMNLRVYLVYLVSDKVMNGNCIQYLIYRVVIHIEHPSPGPFRARGRALHCDRPGPVAI